MSEHTPGRIVVGVTGAGRETAALQYAAARARRDGLEVLLVHAWRLDPAYDDIINTRVADDWRHEREQELAHIVEGVAAAHPDVEVRLDVRHEWPPQPVEHARGHDGRGPADEDARA